MPSAASLPIPQLLLLPGELRNRIYDFCRELNVATVCRHTPTNDKYHISFSSYRGLIHVCRQIREEFLPIYIEDIRIVLTPQTWARGIEIFFPLLKKAIAERKIKKDSLIFPGHVPLDLSQQCGSLLISLYPGFESDVTLLIYLTIQCPKIDVALENGRGCSLGLFHGLRNLLSQSSDAIWSRYFQDCVNEIRIFDCYPTPKLEVTLKQGSGCQEFEVGELNPHEWLSEVGLEITHFCITLMVPVWRHYGLVWVEHHSTRHI